MSSLTYYSLPGFGEHCRENYGFSDACIIGDHMEITGQVGKHPTTFKVPPKLEDEISQAFENVNAVILSALEQAGRPQGNESETKKSGWDYVMKLKSYHVNLSRNQSDLRQVMVRQIQKWCPNHQPLFTMIGIESLPLPDTNVEIEAQVYLG